MSDKMPKVKHDHKWTDLLKVGIFSLVMMAPVTAIGVTCAYVICNKNAYQSYYGETINEVSYTQVEEIETPNQYRFVNDNSLNAVDTNGSKYFTFDKIKDYKLTNNNYNFISLNGDDYSYCILYMSNNVRTLGFVGNDSSITKYIRCEYIDYIDFQNFYSAESIFLSYLKIPEYNKDSYLDNVFYYAVDTMQNNTLFSWTKTTAIYSGVEAMTTGMGVTTSAIAVLLVYWLLCTAIYIIIDIVVKGFTWITHLIGER